MTFIEFCLGSMGSMILGASVDGWAGAINGWCLFVLIAYWVKYRKGRS